MPNEISKIKVNGVDYSIKDAEARSLLNSVLIYKGALYVTTASSGTISKANFEKLTGYKTGWAYLVGEAGTYAGLSVQPGDMLIACANYGTAFANSDWIAIQSNLVNGLFRGTNNFTTNHILIADGTGGQVDSAQVKYDKAAANTDSASTVSGVSVSSATFSGDPSSVSLSGSVSGTKVGDHTYQPAGTVSKPAISLTTSSVIASKINSWSAGTASTVPSLTTDTPTVVTNVSVTAGTAPSLTVTPTTVLNGVTITGGLFPTLSPTTVSVGSASNWNAGTLPALTVTAATVVSGVTYTSPSISSTTATVLKSVSGTTTSIGTVSGETLDLGSALSAVTSTTASVLSGASITGGGVTPTTVSIGSASGWSAGTKPALTVTSKTVMTAVAHTGGSFPTLSTTTTSVGSASAWKAGSVTKVTPTTATITTVDSWDAGTASTIPSLTYSTVAFNNVTAAALASAPTFTGTTTTLKHTVTQGTVSVSGNYTPAGTVKVALTVSTANHSHTIGSTSTAVSITADN